MPDAFRSSVKDSTGDACRAIIYVADANKGDKLTPREDYGMHDSLLCADQVDDFIVLRARVLTSTVRRRVVSDILVNEGLAVLEWQLLFSVARFGTCHVAFITKHTSIDPAHGSRAASALEKRGMINRVPDPRNQRRKLISLTDKGAEAVQRIWPQVQNTTKEMTDRLSRSEFQELKRLLDIVNGGTPPKQPQRFPRAETA